MALATKEDFEGRHGPLSEEDASKVEALLDDASGLIEAELLGIEVDWLGDEPEGDPPPVVKAVCVQIAYRAWSNPDGIAREQLGEFAQTFRHGGEADVLWLTKNEARMVRKAAGAQTVKSVQLETPYSGTAEEVSPLDFWPFEEGS